MKSVSPRQLKARLNESGEMALLDVREAGQFGESHLLFATPLSYSRLELAIGALVPRKSAPVIVCDDGVAGVARRALKRLQDLGYTDVAELDGGTGGWAAQGYALFKGVNVPSKVFGELAEHAYHTPSITVQQLARMRAEGDDFILVDGRPYDEYHRMNIPGGICCPNAELPFRIGSIVTDPRTKIVVNCAGRTRSILGAQTLINFGVPNPVYALENGTQGWSLAGFELERGATRRYPDRVDPTALPALRARAVKLMERFGIKSVDARVAEGWLNDASRTTYVLDVRTPEEYAAGSIPGAVHAPGGQLIQATDQWVAVRNARVVLLDGGDQVRAPVAASWLRQLGCDAYVLEGGLRSGLAARAAERPPLPEVPPISAEDLKAALEAGRCSVFDLGPSMHYRKTHIPGSRWSIRPRLANDARASTRPVTLVAEEPDVGRLAATELVQAGIAQIDEIRLLEGGMAAWRGAGYAVDSSPGVPPDAECIDFLFFVHDRHAGNREAMKQYLSWETGLLGMLDEQDRRAFHIPAH